MEGCIQEQLEALGLVPSTARSPDTAAQCMGLRGYSGSLVTWPREGVGPVWCGLRIVLCGNGASEGGQRPSSAPRRPCLFVLSQQLSIEMNGISRTSPLLSAPLQRHRRNLNVHAVI